MKLKSIHEVEELGGGVIVQHKALITKWQIDMQGHKS